MTHTGIRKTPQKQKNTVKRRRKLRPEFIKFCIIMALVLALAGWLISLTCAVNDLNGVLAASAVEVEKVVDQNAKAPKTAKFEPTEAKQEPTAYFKLTNEQRALVEQVVSAECRGEPYDGQVAVAQCILNACLKDDIAPEQAIEDYQYTDNRAEPTESVKKAVSAVFDKGEGITEDPIIYFYNPTTAENGEFHESQSFVLKIANHKFFKEVPSK